MATYVKVRAMRDAGFRRAGYFWPSSETFARVDDDAQLKMLETEPMLKVQKVSESELKPEQRASADYYADQLKASREGTQPASRDLLVDADFPRLTSAPGGEPVLSNQPDLTTGSPPQSPPPPPPSTQEKSDPAMPVNDLPLKQDEPPSETHVATSGGSFFSGEKKSKK